MMKAFFFLQLVFYIVFAHVEDICVGPPGNCSTCGIYNFFSKAADLNCGYLDKRPECVLAATEASANSGFVEVSNCRGAIHFQAIYFTAVALGFKQEIAYHMAAFSQAIDFVQYKGIDSCGQAMDNKWWTPPLRGLLRTETAFGGTNRHISIPFVGMYDSITITGEDASGGLKGPPLRQSEKKYNGGSKRGCQRHQYRRSAQYYKSRCPGLNPDVNVNNKDQYDGALSAGKRWAFGETEILCNAGFTKPHPVTKSLFTGLSCPTAGQQYAVDIGVPQQGPIPLTNQNLVLGDQVFHFECTPNCSTTPNEVIPESVVRTSDFAQYLLQQSVEHGYATLNDPPGPVPNLIVRFGFFLHWLNDRNSHWYCGDAPESGIKAVPAEGEEDVYNLYMYMSPRSCNFVGHGMVHYWEQAVETPLAPGSYYALVDMYVQIREFRTRFLLRNPEWFRQGASLLSQSQVVGTPQRPGILYQSSIIMDAKERVLAEMAALKTFNLPPMPGFEHLCGEE